MFQRISIINKSKHNNKNNKSQDIVNFATKNQRLI